jgi:hypothetical protein
MDFNDMYEEIDLIAESQELDDRQKIDELLRIDAMLYANMGIDSTPEERADTKKRSRLIYRMIKTIDMETGELFLRAMRNESD